MGYNQKKKSKKLKQQWISVQIERGGSIAKPGKGSRRGNNKPKIVTRRMRKLLAEIQQEDSELLELQEQMLENSSDTDSKNPTSSKKSKDTHVPTEDAQESSDDDTKECPMEM